jgi:hypothetical protein
VEQVVFDTQDELEDNKLGNGRLKPWESNPYQLISWWDMEQFGAVKFYYIGVILEKIKRDFGTGNKKDLYPLDEDVRLGLEKRYLRFIELECRKIGLRNSAETVREFRNKLLAWKVIDLTSNQVATRIDEIARAIRREMKLNLFMYIPVDRAEYCQSWGESKRAERGEQIMLFGNGVKEKFPSADYDVIEAGNCFAAGRHTACVFHLMAVLEVGLITLAKKFNVPSENKNWQNIIEPIESKIRGMGSNPARSSDWKSEQEFYSQVAIHFMFLKDAWRNSVAHGRGKYTEEEAKRIMENVRGFMQKLATKLSE